MLTTFLEIARNFLLVIKEYRAKRKSPLIWRKERTSLFWEKECQECSDLDFKNIFRLERRSFFELCDILKGIGKEDTNYRKAITLEKRIAIALYALGSSAEYRTVASLFGVSNSSVCRIVREFCAAVWNALKPNYLNYFPLTETVAQTIVNDFNNMGFPQCIGALDGCHIEVKPKKEDAVDYYNYKGWYSVVLLALVDSRYRFLYINVGSPGRCNDSGIYERSSLKAELLRCKLLYDQRKSFNNVEIPLVIIADSAFRLSRNVLKPFPFNVENTTAQREFNYRLSRCRRVVENAFGHLKARFRRIGKGLDNRIDNTNAIIKACCVLHNFLISQRDYITDTWLPDPGSMTEEQSRVVPLNERRLNLGDCYRNALSQHFAQDPIQSSI
ncbi:protein ALP1-like [Ceratitis capitata]|nr:protein ALP1-like [Ceratitis capitata]